VKLSFRDKTLERLDQDSTFSAGLDFGIVKALRKRIQQLEGAPNEQCFYEAKSWHYEKLDGPRAHQHSIRLNDKMRLIIEIENVEPERIIIVVGIEDYH
jgi:proteic killer suppression protein